MTTTISGTTGVQQPATQLAGSSSGVVTLTGAANAGTWTMTLPTSGGTSGYVLGTDGTGITNWVAQTGGSGGSGTVNSGLANQLAYYAANGTAVSGGFAPTTAGNVLFTTDGSTWSSTQKIVRGTAVATTSGTSVDFTSIPSWVKRITVMFQNVSLSGTANILLQIGTGGSPTTTGYISGTSSIGSVATSTSSTSGVPIYLSFAAGAISGSIVFTNFSSNIWTANGVFGYNGATGTATSGGSVSLGGVLNIVRITTTNGTDTFDAGSVNLLWE